MNFPSNYQNLSGGHAPCAGGAGFSRAERIVNAPETETDSERGQMAAVVSWPSHAGETSNHTGSATSHATCTSPSTSPLRRRAYLGRVSCLLFRNFSCRGDSGSFVDLLRSGVVPLLGRCGHFGGFTSGTCFSQVVQDRPVRQGHGTEVSLGATGDEICPVTAVSAYVARRGRSAGAFFCLEDGLPLTKARFVEGVRSALARAGVRQTGYSGHSFRIGAATAAAQVGLPDSMIQALGRWSTPAFLRYIRTPREELAQFSNSLARRL